MIDSSKFPIVEAGLKWVQGKSIVNSISLKVTRLTRGLSGFNLFLQYVVLPLSLTADTSAVCAVVLIYDVGYVIPGI